MAGEGWAADVERCGALCGVDHCYSHLAFHFTANRPSGHADNATTLHSWSFRVPTRLDMLHHVPFLQLSPRCKILLNLPSFENCWNHIILVQLLISFHICWLLLAQLLFMAALFLPCGFFYLPIFYLFSRLISAVADWMSAILQHMVWLSVNLRCRSETCCTGLAENTEYRTQKVAKKSPSGHHRATLSGYIFTTKARIDNWKKTC